MVTGEKQKQILGCPCLADLLRMTGTPPPFLVTAHSKGLKVALFSMSCEWLVSAHSKGLTDAVCALLRKWKTCRSPTATFRRFGAEPLRRSRCHCDSALKSALNLRKPARLAALPS